MGRDWDAELERVKAQALERKAKAKIEARRANKQEAKFKAIFDQIDEDKTGGLDVNEMFEFMAIICPQVTKTEVVEVFEEIDVDGDGDLTFEEFMNWIENPDKKAAVSNKFLVEAIEVVDIPEDALVEKVKSSIETGCKTVVMSLKRWKQWGTDACIRAVGQWKLCLSPNAPAASISVRRSVPLVPVPRLNVNSTRVPKPSRRAPRCGKRGVGCCKYHDRMRGMVLLCMNKTLRRRRDAARTAIWNMVDAMRDQS